MAVNPKVQAYVDARKAVDARKVAAIADIEADFTKLLDTIKELNERPIGWGPEDQALVDESLKIGEGIATQLEAAAKIVSEPTPPAPEG